MSPFYQQDYSVSWAFGGHLVDAEMIVWRPVNVCQTCCRRGNSRFKGSLLNLVTALNLALQFPKDQKRMIICCLGYLFCPVLKLCLLTLMRGFLKVLAWARTVSFPWTLGSRCIFWFFYPSNRRGNVCKEAIEAAVGPFFCYGMHYSDIRYIKCIEKVKSVTCFENQNLLFPWCEE